MAVVLARNVSVYFGVIFEMMSSSTLPARSDSQKCL